MIQIALLALAFSGGPFQDSPLQAPQPAAPPPPVSIVTDRTDPSPFNPLIQPWEWVEPPMPLYPLEALVKETKTGTTRMRCRSVDARGIVSNCEVLSELPAGQGFGAEQLAAMPSGRLSPTGIARMQREGSLTFTTHFLPPDEDVRDRQGRIPEDLPPRRRRGTGSFAFDGQAQAPGRTWDIPPNVSIPRQAIALDIIDGFAVVGCNRVSEDRVLSGCRIFAESHANAGFGQAVLNAMPRARASEDAAAAVARGEMAMFRIRFGLR
ncbi:hypothetical protein [Brevundimonas sp.]